MKMSAHFYHSMKTLRRLLARRVVGPIAFLESIEKRRLCSYREARFLSCGPQLGHAPTELFLMAVESELDLGSGLWREKPTVK